MILEAFGFEKSRILDSGFFFLHPWRFFIFGRRQVSREGKGGKGKNIKSKKKVDGKMVFRLLPCFPYEKCIMENVTNAQIYNGARMMMSQIVHH